MKFPPIMEFIASVPEVPIPPCSAKDLIAHVEEKMSKEMVGTVVRPGFMDRFRNTFLQLAHHLIIIQLTQRNLHYGNRERELMNIFSRVDIKFQEDINRMSMTFRTPDAIQRIDELLLNWTCKRCDTMMVKPHGEDVCNHNVVCSILEA